MTYVRYGSLSFLGIVLLSPGSAHGQAPFLNGQAAVSVLGQNAFGMSAYADRLSSPAGIAVHEASGAVFVADGNNNRVLRFRSMADLTTGKAADRVFGQPDPISRLPNRGGGPGAATLNAPAGVAVDDAGILYVADGGNHRVLRFDNVTTEAADGAPASRVFGQSSSATGLPNRGGSGANAGSLDTPHGVAIDGSGRLYVADQNNNRVVRFDNASTAASDGPEGQGVLGQADFTANLPNRWGSVGAGTLRFPRGVAVSGSGDLYVADMNNHRVLRFVNPERGSNGQDAVGVFGQASFTTAFPNRGELSVGPATASTLLAPQSVGLDANGKLYIVDTGNSRVLRFDTPASNVSGASAARVFGQANFTGRFANQATGSVNLAGMSAPLGISVDASGRMYVSDTGNHRVLRYDDASAGVANGVEASLVLGQNGASVSAYPVSLARPFGVAIHAGSGKVFVSDTDNHRVLRYGSLASHARGQAAEQVFGQSDMVSRQPNRGGRVTAAGLDAPTGVAVDEAGRLYVADWGNNRVLRFDDATTVAEDGVSASRVIGQADFTSGLVNRGGSVSAASLRRPYGIAVDASAHLFVADTDNNRVLRFDGAATGNANGPDASAVFGQAGFAVAMANRGGGAGSATLNSPFGVAVDDAGRLYVADRLNHRVVRFADAATSTGEARADAVFGQQDFLSRSGHRGGQAGGATMSVPTGVAVDGLGRLYVADQFSHRVLVFDGASTGASFGPSADVVLGQPTFTAVQLGPISATTLYLPASVAVDRVSRQLWVVDQGHNRVLAFSALHPLSVRRWPDATDGGLSFIPSGRNAFRLRVHSGGLVNVRLFDVLGRHVAVLGAADIHAGGELAIALPVNVASGVYVMQAVLEAGGLSAQQSVSRTVVVAR